MSPKARYEIIEHTADVGIRVEAPTLKELFADAAYGMFDLLCNARALRTRIEQPVTIEANDYEELLVNWLSELLFLFDTRRFLFCQFDIAQLSRRHLRAVVRGEKYSPARHELGHDIKAVTYFGLQVERENSKWTAAVIFDV